MKTMRQRPGITSRILPVAAFARRNGCSTTRLAIVHSKRFANLFYGSWREELTIERIILDPVKAASGER